MLRSRVARGSTRAAFMATTGLAAAVIAVAPALRTPRLTERWSTEDSAGRRLPPPSTAQLVQENHR